MITVSILIGIYLVVAGLAATMTYDEQQRSSETSLAFAALGYVACALWPLTFLMVVIAAQMPFLSKT